MNESPQADLQVSPPPRSRKHALPTDDSAAPIALARQKRARINNDISVLPASTDGMDDSASNDGDRSDEDDDEDEYQDPMQNPIVDIDPSLDDLPIPRAKKPPVVPSTSRAPRRVSPPASFAQNTGSFLALAPSDHLDNPSIIRPPGGPTPVDYTHISQALAHQPLATNSSQQTVSLMQKLASAGTQEGATTEERLEGFVREVQNQMYALSQRVDVVETARFASAASFSTLQAAFTSLQAKVAATDSLVVPPLNSNPLSDALNERSAEEMSAHLHRQLSEYAKGGLNGAEALTPDFLSSIAIAASSYGVNGVVPDLPVAGPSVGRKKSKKTPAKKEGSEGLGGDVKPGPRKRKPELSRAVRGTMFKLLNLQLANSTTKYHGYTSSPELPDFSETPIFDSTTGQRAWRWEWDKTIRQSPFNTQFSTAIQTQVLDDREKGLLTDIPEADWAGLEDAVESAYTNLRRERESQVNPAKKMKKEEHRKRGKKRGLKEEKRVRRVAAYSDGTAGGTLVDAREDGASQTWTNLLSTFTSEGDDLGEALDIRYMSSEEEVDTNDPEILASHVADIDVLGSSSLVAGEKAFYVHRPAWRSERLSKAYAELDALKPAEKAYRRIIGAQRSEYPPEGTPSWMISEAWQEDLVSKGGIPRYQRSAKGKGKAEDA